MSRWKRLSRNRRTTYLALVVFVLAATAWAASGRFVTQVDEELAAAQPSALAKAAALDAPLLPPDEVLIQKTSAFGDFGNVLVTVRLSAEQLAGKEEDGTRDFVVIGNPEAPVILRDDGLGGDAVKGDGVFSGPAFISDAELEARSTADNAEFNSRTSKTIPVFAGRAAVGVAEAEPFDYEGFKAGRAVALDPAVAFVDPEGTRTVTVSPEGPIAVGEQISSLNPVDEGTNDFQERVLIIRNVGVVTDPNRTFNPCDNATNPGNPDGVWTFKHLATQMANQSASGIHPADFVENWLKNWNPATPHNINGDPTIANRPLMNTIINQFWPRVGGKLDLNRAPLRLLAILPRLDLRRTTGGGGAYSINANGNFLDAGEARFVFGFVAPNSTWTGFPQGVSIPQIPGQPTGCRALPFTVIFEYRVAKCKCEDVRSWARQWKALDDPLNLPGSAVYNSRLEAITEQFVTANANPRNPNGSSLGQLRTNEIALLIPWELREFQLTQFPFTFLQETTVEDTPEDGFNGFPVPTANPTLLNWILNINPALSGPDFEDPIPGVPLFFPTGTNFMAANSIVPDGPGVIRHHWTAQGLNINVTQNPGNAAILQENWARHRVSRAACNGCHRRETFTHFVHIDPSNTIPGSNPALPAEISVFLSGINNLGDPADAAANGLLIQTATNGNPKRNFDDLARRELDIQRVANMTCFKFHPVSTAHVKANLRATGQLPADLFTGMTLVPVEDRVSVAVDDMTANHISEVH
ncbi:MAG TPA: hypothetical protein VF789_09675 [Thermoanaerobaculia bacterium]